MPSYPCRLRKYRKSAILSQRELGLLLGLDSQSIISQYESATRRPSLRAFLACELVFGVPARSIFPALYAEVEREIGVHARELIGQLGKTNARHQTAAALAALIERLDSNASGV